MNTEQLTRLLNINLRNATQHWLATMPENDYNTLMHTLTHTTNATDLTKTIADAGTNALTTILNKTP